MNTKIKLTEEDQLRNENKLLRDNVNELLSENIKLKKEKEALNSKIKNVPDVFNYNIIDFGIGKLRYHIEKGGSITLVELMEAINKAAMTTPLNQIIAKLKGLSRF